MGTKTMVVVAMLIGLVAGARVVGWLQEGDSANRTVEALGGPQPQPVVHERR